MPLYEYHCEKCGRDHEIMRKLSARPLKICPSCGGPIKKVISASAFQLKGSGWYKDGYATPKPEKKTDTKEEKPAEKKPEPKPSAEKKT